MNDELEIIDGIMYRNGVKIATMGTPKFVYNSPKSLARGLKLEKDSNVKYYNLIVDKDGTLKERIEAKPSDFFADEDKREFSNLIGAFRKINDKLIDMQKVFNDDEDFIRHQTNFDRFFRGEDYDTENEKNGILHLIRMAHNAGFYERNGCILIGAPSEAISLQDMIQSIFVGRCKYKKELRGIYRNSIAYFIMRYSSKFCIDREEMRKFWAYAFYGKTKPDKEEILKFDRLDLRKYLPILKV